MSDDLDRLNDRLRDRLKAAPPAPDPDARARTLARAMENFDAHTEAAQETAPEPRPTSDRPDGAGFLTGVRAMLNRLTKGPILAATASAAALGAGLMILMPSLTGGPHAPLKAPVAPTVTPTVAPTVAPSATVAPKPENPPEAATRTVAPADPAAPVTEAAPPAALPRAAAPMPAASMPAAPAADASGAAAPSEAEALSEPMVEPMVMPAPSAKMAAPAPVTIEGSAAFGYADRIAPPAPTDESFANGPANPVKVTAEEPVSTFSVDVDTASWSIVRSSLAAGVLPPPEAVRVEEMVNYFPYSYPAPAADGAPFSTSVTLFQTPWNKDTELLRIGLQGRMPATTDRPPLDLVFLIDTSGSMDEPAKLPLLVQSFRLMLDHLRPEDRVAIVAYAGSAGLVLEPTAASDRARIDAGLAALQAGGSTAGAAGLTEAYRVAGQMKQPGHVARVILATDGDFNVGIDDPQALEAFIAKERDSGTYLSVLGFGRGNLDDATMQALAQTGNGTAAYIDTEAEPQNVLSDQQTVALYPNADDVKVQDEINHATVAEYRLIGYETRALQREDFNNDKVDAGEIGAGVQVTALYEVTPLGSPARLSDPSRYVVHQTRRSLGELAFLKLRYKAPGAKTSERIEEVIPPTPTLNPDDDARFAAAIAGMGQLLTGGKYLGDWGWTEAITLADGARGPDADGYRAEAVRLMRLAAALPH